MASKWRERVPLHAMVSLPAKLRALPPLAMPLLLFNCIKVAANKGKAKKKAEPFFSKFSLAENGKDETLPEIIFPYLLKTLLNWHKLF